MGSESSIPHVSDKQINKDGVSTLNKSDNKSSSEKLIKTSGLFTLLKHASRMLLRDMSTIDELIIPKITDSIPATHPANVKTSFFWTSNSTLNQRVCISGTFNEWRKDQLMARNDGSQLYKYDIDLMPGRYEFKFIINGVWKCSQEYGKSYDQNKNENNVISIIKLEVDALLPQETVLKHGSYSHEYSDLSGKCKHVELDGLSLHYNKVPISKMGEKCCHVQLYDCNVEITWRSQE